MAMRRKYATMRHQWDVAQRREDSAAETVMRGREISALMCSWKTFIRIETKEINIACTVHSQLVRSRFASLEMCITGHFQN
jgi:hypothetical protein